MKPTNARRNLTRAPLRPVHHRHADADALAALAFVAVILAVLAVLAL